MQNRMTIAKCIEAVAPFWLQNEGAAESVAAFEKQRALTLPSDFKTFFTWSDGGRGVFPHIYLDLWKAEQFDPLGRDYQIDHYLGDAFVPFGSDGGSICFLLDYRTLAAPAIACVNFGDLDIDEVKVIAPSLTEFLMMAVRGSLVNEDL